MESNSVVTSLCIDCNSIKRPEEEHIDIYVPSREKTPIENGLDLLEWLSGANKQTIVANAMLFNRIYLAAARLTGTRKNIAPTKDFKQFNEKIKALTSE